MTHIRKSLYIYIYMLFPRRCRWQGHYFYDLQTASPINRQPTKVLPAVSSPRNLHSIFADMVTKRAALGNEGISGVDREYGLSSAKGMADQRLVKP